MRSLFLSTALRPRGIAALGLVVLLASSACAASPLGKAPVLSEKTQGIFYVAAKRPYVMVVFGSSAGDVKHRAIALEAKTPEGKVFARWLDVGGKMNSDGTLAKRPSTLIVANSPKHLPVVLKVCLPNYVEGNGGYPLVWVNRRWTKFRHDPKPPYQYGTLRVRGGRTVVKVMFGA